MYPGHAALNPTPELRKARLGRLAPDDQDPVYGLLPFPQVKTRWWEPYTECA